MFNPEQTTNLLDGATKLGSTDAAIRGDGLSRLISLSGSSDPFQNAATYASSSSSGSLYLGEGNHIVTTGSGDDQVYVGAANDFVNAGDGNNTLYLGEGFNVAVVRAGNNTIYGGAASDVVSAGDGNNTLYLGEGVNVAVTGLGNNLIYAGASGDVIKAGNGNNTIYAAEGDNFVWTGAGNDLIYAGAGDDVIFSGAGNDKIYAGDGNNFISAVTGEDTVYTGSGANRFELTKGDGSVTIIGFGCKDSIRFADGTTPSNLSFTVQDGDTLVKAGDDLLATLKWVQFSGISIDNSPAPINLNPTPSNPTPSDLGLLAEEGFPTSAGEVSTPIFGNGSIEGALEEDDPENSLRPSHFADDYALTDVTGGQRVTVKLNSSEFNPCLQVVNAATGELLAENNDANGSTNSELTFKVQQGVDYFIRVTSDDANALGKYTLSTSTSSPFAGDLSLNQTLTGTLSTDDLSNQARPGSFDDEYRLQGITAGQQVKLTLNSTEFDGYLQLLDAKTGQLLGENDYVSRPEDATAELSFTVQAGIQYSVRVTSYQSGEIGSYQVGLLPADSTIVPDGNVFGILGQGDQANPTRPGSLRDDYLLSGTASGQRLQINLKSDDFDPYLQLINADTGQVIAENDDFQAGILDSRLNFAVQNGVNYLVRVTNATGGVVGRYTLSGVNLNTDWFTSNLRDSTLQNSVRQQTSDGILSREDMLGIFNQVAQNSTISRTELADIRRMTNTNTPFYMPNDVRDLSARAIASTPTNPTVFDFTNTTGSLFLVGTQDGPPPPEFHEREDDGKLKRTVKFDYVDLKGTLLGKTDAKPSNDGSSGSERHYQVSHIDQGGFGDCTFLAALGATFKKSGNERFNTDSGQRSSIIDSMIRRNADGTYSVRFYDFSGTAHWVTVDQKIESQRQVLDKDGKVVEPDKVSADESGVRLLFGADIDGHDSNREFGKLRVSNGDDYPVWVPIVERAYAIFRQQIRQTELNAELKRQLREQQANGTVPDVIDVRGPLKAVNGWDLIGNGDISYDVLRRVTGVSVSYYALSNGQRANGANGSNNFSWELLKQAINAPNRYVEAEIGGGEAKSSSSSGKGKGKSPNGKLVTHHAYSVLDAYEENGQKYVVVRNPWGQDNFADVILEHDPDPSQDLATRKKDYNPNSWTGDKWDGFITLTYAEFVNSFSNVAITDGAVGTSLVDDNAPPPLPQDPDGDFSRAFDLGTVRLVPNKESVQTVDKIGFAEASGRDENDYYRFSVTGGNLSLFIGLNGFEQGTTQLALYNSAQRKIDFLPYFGDNARSPELSPGTYYVRVSPGAATIQTDYKLELYPF